MPQEECICEGQTKVFGDHAEEAMGSGEHQGVRAVKFLPEAQDLLPQMQENEQMGPIGPWASGRVDWGPLAGLTGTRPVVDNYSITRFSEGEWRKHNHEVLCGASEDQRRANVAIDTVGYQRYLEKLEARDVRGIALD
ncbi:hypothetical protein J6590_044328 [Homalodisca vitripennis]|nr:hypothetical protein J6590_044328 [Homalodisca vitripennis]